MKKVFTLLALASCFYASAQTLLRESFIYPTGSIVTNSSGVWLENTSGGNTNPISVDASSLTYPNMASFGGKVNFAGAGQDVVAALSAPVTSGTVYASCLVNFSAVTTGGEYFIHFSQSTTQNNYFGRVFVRSTTGGFNVGLMKNSGGSAPYGTTLYTLNTTYCVVLKYTFNTASGTDDEVKLYMFPSTSSLPSTEPATSELTVVTNSDATSLSAFAIRQGSAAAAATGSVDNLVVSTTWNDVAATLPVQIQQFTGVVNGNTAQLNWHSSNEQNFNYYGVEKSANGIHFSAIGKVISTRSNQYNFTDANLLNKQFYRLKLVDKDGSFTYSNVVTVSAAKRSSLQVIPNPVSAEAVLLHSASTKGDRVNIVAANGSVVKSLTVADNTEQTKLTVQGLASGRYQVVYLAADGTQKATSLLKH